MEGEKENKMLKEEVYKIPLKPLGEPETTILKHNDVVDRAII
jgi:hypothetical protein